MQFAQQASAGGDVINLVSTQACSDVISGPAKVYRNLAKGLGLIGYPYVVNRALGSTSRVWVHDDPVALRYVSRSGARAVVGPNLFVLPRDIPPQTDLAGMLYVHPSPWVIAVWTAAGFDACPMAAWPVGIDLDELHPTKPPEARYGVLVYHKLRRRDELQRIRDSLDRAAVPHEVVRYGFYDQADYVNALRDTCLVVWHGRHESQGIALQEALAMDVPVLVCDVKSMSEEEGGAFPPELDELPATAAPYFDTRCGWRTYALDDVGGMAAQMLAERSSFSPREYVEENLSLEAQARRFVALWEHFGLTLEEGFSERSKSNKAWREPNGTKVLEFIERARSGIRTRIGGGRLGGPKGS